MFHCLFALTIFFLLIEFSFYELNLTNVEGFTLKIYSYAHMNVITCTFLLGVIVSHLEFEIQA